MLVLTRNCTDDVRSIFRRSLKTSARPEVPTGAGASGGQHGIGAAHGGYEARKKVRKGVEKAVMLKKLKARVMVKVGSSTSRWTWVCRDEMFGGLKCENQVNRTIGSMNLRIRWVCLRRPVRGCEKSGAMSLSLFSWLSAMITSFKALSKRTILASERASLLP